MIQIDGIPRSMYGRDAAPVPSFGGPSNSGAGPAAAAGPSRIEDDGGTADGGQPPAGWGERMRNRREYTMLKKVVRLLQDNRLNDDDGGETAHRLQEINRNQSDSYPILKTILNGLFITTGVVLLVGVVVVIIYTSFVPTKENDGSGGDGHGHNPDGGALGQDADSSDADDGGGGGGGDTRTDFEGDDDEAQDLAADSLPSTEYHEQPHVSHGTPVDTKPPNVPSKGGGGGGGSSGQKTRRPAAPTTPPKTREKCNYVPIVYSGETTVRLGRICYEVPNDGS